jgi:4a-hydroxytetrahydrobiopterin dehydratase
MNKTSDIHCEKITAASIKLGEQEAKQLLAALKGWQIITVQAEARLDKEFKFKDFARAAAFTSRLAGISEAENHHPAILTEWGKVTVSWWTHKVKGLHQNDFIMAAKTDELFANEPAG